MARLPVDLEELARILIRSGVPDDVILQELSEAADSGHWARAILTEVRATEKMEGVSSDFLRKVLTTPRAGIGAGASGLGCRGEGDFFIHRQIANMAGEGGVIGVPDQDDSGVVRFTEGDADGKGLVAVAVDGVHSRLDEFPFLMGFHVARATLRDILVSGARPLALISDIHIGNDGDVGKILDFTAGLTTVGDALGFPLVAGSTLRIGGDMVLGGRLTGCAGAVGEVLQLTPRRGVRQGDVLLMTEGAGGGTIATTALFNGVGHVAEATLNLRSLRAGLAVLDSGLVERIHSMTDVTNGGLRGDALHMAETSGVSIELDPEAFERCIDRSVLDMLKDLDIDPLGVSIDTLLFSVDEVDIDRLSDVLSGVDLRVHRIGEVKDGEERGTGVFLKDEEGGSSRLLPRFREAPYTPIKKVVDNQSEEPEEMRRGIERAGREALEKKRMVLDRL